MGWHITLTASSERPNATSVNANTHPVATTGEAPSSDYLKIERPEPR